MKSIEPKISVITVVRNGVDSISDTIKSVISQDYKNIEYLVIDGNSSDGTKEKIVNFINKIDYFISEPDRGIYDAMNKGINRATGDYVIFMNGGDKFYSKKSISNVFDNNPSEDIIFADGIANLYGTKHPLPIDSNKKIELYRFFCDSSLCHQATFIRLKLLKKIGGYSLDYKIISDHYFNYLAIKKYHASTVYVQTDVAMIDVSGISMMNIDLLKKELKNMRHRFFDLKQEFMIWRYYLNKNA